MALALYEAKAPSLSKRQCSSYFSGWSGFTPRILLRPCYVHGAFCIRLRAHWLRLAIECRSSAAWDGSGAGVCNFSTEVIFTNVKQQPVSMIFPFFPKTTTDIQRVLLIMALELTYMCCPIHTENPISSRNSYLQCCNQNYMPDFSIMCDDWTIFCHRNFIVDRCPSLTGQKD